MLREIAFGAATLKILPAALLASMAAVPALARQDPTPPPSGIVVHLFGPDSVASHILPTTPSSPQAGQTGQTGQTEQAAPQSGEAQGASTPAQTTAGPSVGDILHQMFVTGDPAQDGKPNFSSGRGGSF